MYYKGYEAYLQMTKIGIIQMSPKGHQDRFMISLVFHSLFSYCFSFNNSNHIILCKHLRKLY